MNKKHVIKSTILIVVIGAFITSQFSMIPLAKECQIQNTTSANSQWTAIYYLCGDNKMSASQQHHLDIIQSVGSTADVKIAVLIDQNQEGDTRLYYLEGSELIQQTWEEESNMDDPETLKEFIIQAMTDLPSDQYYLQLSSNKGSGWQGVCYDQRGDGTMITMPELSEVLLTATNQGSQKIDVMAVETCLGGNLAFAYQVQPYCDYYVGYADCGLVGGWPFQESLSTLVGNPSMEPSTFASTIVDAFTPQDIPQYMLMTAIGALDLSQITTLKNNIDALGQYFIDNIDDYNSVIITALEGIRIYGEMWDIDYFIDFAQFLNEVSFIDQEGESLKDQILASIEAMVINKKHLQQDNCEGFNFYFPHKTQDFNHALRYDNGILPETYEQTSLAQDSSWDEFLKTLLGIANNNAPATPTITGTQDGKAGEPYEYSISTSDPENDQIFYYIDWGDDTNSDWQGPYTSEEAITISHSWIERDTYTIKVKARDDKGAESDWKALTVTMPKQKKNTLDTIFTFLLGKIAEIEKNQQGDFRFLPIKLLTIIFGGGQAISLDILDETNGGYPCCGYIDPSNFHGFLGSSFIMGIWAI